MVLVDVPRLDGHAPRRLVVLLELHDGAGDVIRTAPCLLHLQDKAAAAGLPVRHLTYDSVWISPSKTTPRRRRGALKFDSRRYEELNDDHSKLDDIREWILGDQASEPRCAPDHRNTTLKVHVGPVSGHVANWDAVEETLRGTRYEHLLSE